jgi:serine phosphatase RsbU (regulator of sigma subunit)
MDTASGKLSFSGIGNIEAHIISGGKRHYLLSLGGIVGHTMRTPRVFEHNFNSGDTLALYSDGITSSWQHEFENWQQHPQQIAEEILETHSRESDDATILIIRNTSPHR